MRVSKKIWIISGAVMLLIIMFLVLFPFYVKSYINKNGKELTGRTLKLQGLYHNPLTGYTRLRGFEMLEPTDTAVFVSFDTLIVNFDLYKMLTRTLSISEIRLVHPEIQVTQYDSLFNYTDLVQRFSENETESPDSTEDQNLNIELKNISLVDGSTSYFSMADQRQWHFHDIDVSIPGLYFDNQNTDVDLDLALVDGGELLSNTQYNNELGTYQVNLQLSGINLAPVKEYIQDYLDVSDFGATLDADLQITGRLGFFDELALTGTVHVNDYYFDDPKQSRFLSGEKVTTVIEQVTPFKPMAVIQSITVSNPAVFYELYVDSTDNIQPLLKQQEEDLSQSDTSSQDFELLVRTIKVEGGKLDFIDHNPETPFEYQFFDIAIDMSNITPEDVAKIALNAKAPEQGVVALEWEGNVFDPDPQSFTLKTNIPGLPAFSPYTISFFDVPITRGSFNYISTNHINNGILEGLHTILASDLTVGERKGFKSLYDVPIKIGLYLLEDKNGDIELQIPVEGDVDDPTFRYSKIVVKAIVNGIVKLVTSPIALVGKLVGAGDDFKDLHYNPVNIEITPDLETKLNYLAEAIEQKPQLKIKMIQHYDPEQAGKDLAVYLVKEDFYKKTHENTSIIDYYIVDNIDPKGDDFREYLTTESGQEVKNPESVEEACFSIKEEQVKPAMDTINIAWNERVTTYLLAKNVPPESVQIEESQNDKGKFEFELQAELADEMGASSDSIAAAE